MYFRKIALDTICRINLEGGGKMAGKALCFQIKTEKTEFRVWEFGGGWKSQIRYRREDESVERMSSRNL